MKHYTDIYDCPWPKYRLCIENNNDVRHLVKEGEYKESAHKNTLFAVVEKIRDQIIDNFKLNPKLDLYYYKLKELNKLEIELLCGNESAQTRIDIVNSQIKKIFDDQDQEPDLRKYHTRLERIIQTTYPGRTVKELTVFEFYTDIQDISENNRKEEVKREKEKHLGRRHG